MSVKLPEFELEGYTGGVLMDGLYRNHGYYRDAQHTCESSEVNSVLRSHPPAHEGSPDGSGEYVLSSTIGEDYCAGY